MRINNNFNVLPWYDSISRQNSKKWYSFGQHYPLICPNNSLLPFQFVIDTQIETTGNIKAVSVESGDVIDLGIRPSVTLGTQTDANYYIVKQGAASIPELPVGLYYFTLSTSAGVLYSEEVVVVDNIIDYVKIEYWNESTLNFTNGEIDFSDDFRFNLYVNTTIGKPEYQFEEELTKRLGYKFIESQTSNKLYRFNFLAPEYLCDSMRLVRLCDYIKISTKDDSYNALTFAYEPKWQEQGDLAAVECEFETDCIIQKLESFNRRLKESFYNALLHELDEPILFSTDTIAQYYNEFTTTALVNGKLIRQLDAMQVVELRENTPNIFLPVDNISDNSQKAKKLSISDLLALSNISDISKLFKGHFDEDGNLLWIEALSHIGVNGGVTMFIDNGTMSLPQLYSGLPIDGITLIRDENGVLMINPDIDLGGASTWDELIGKPSWIGSTKPSYNYSEILQTPDLSVYALAKDLEKYVTLNTEQTIAAHKNFLNGLSVDGLGITKSQDDVVYIDANLVVRGGITMYATDTVDVPSIIDSLPTASTSAKGLASFDPNFFSVDDNGNVSFIGSTGGIDESVLSDYAKKTDLSAYLSLNGGQMTGNIGYTLSPDSRAVGLPAAGYFEYSSSQGLYASLGGYKSFLGSVYNVDTKIHYHVISIRHRNGLNDGSNYGLSIITELDSAGGNLRWNKNYAGSWQGERVILDSVNWSQYVTAGDGGNYLPLSGGTLTQGSQSNTLTVHATMASSSWLTPFRALTSNLQKGGYCNIDVGKSSTPRNLAWLGFKYDSDGSYDNLLTMGLNSVDNALVINGYGYIGIGTLNPKSRCDINGKLTIRTETSSNLVSSVEMKNTDTDLWQLSARYTTAENGYFKIFYHNGSTWTTTFSLSRYGDLLVNGGITMYSDQRKKTILNHVELTLQQIADAPLIEHYYNSDAMRTTHVGSIAQYWAGLNDWFCKKDSEGFYIMEIQNAALASAISIARELSRYETKTDRKIRELKKRIKQLECKINQLKSA